MTKKANPCICCGCKPHAVQAESNYGSSIIVSCKMCGVSSAMFASAHTAIDHWNEINPIQGKTSDELLQSICDRLDTINEKLDSIIEWGK